MERISTKWRLALAAKGALLVALAALFVDIAVRAVLDDGTGFVLALVAVVVAAPLAAFLGFAASLAFADVVLGQARSEVGPVRCLSRRTGVSARLASGRTVEYVLWNPWDKLVDGRTYRVTYGRRSGVMVARPVPVDGPA